MASTRSPKLTRILVTSSFNSDSSRVSNILFDPELDVNSTITTVVSKKKSSVQYDIYGRSALYLAIWLCNPHSSADCVRLLLSHPGIDRNFRNTEVHPEEVQCRMPWFPLALAMRKGNTEILTMLMADPPPFPSDCHYPQPRPLDFTAVLDDSWTPLHYAAQNGHARCVQLFLERLREEECKNKKRNKKNKKQCKKCSNCQKQWEEGEPKMKRCGRCKKASYCSPACQRLAWKDHKKSCKKFKESQLGTFLVKQMINKRLKAKQAIGHKLGVMVGGATALFLAAEMGHADVVKELLKYDECDFNLPSVDGKTPFMTCVIASNSSSALCQSYQKGSDRKPDSHGSLAIANMLLDLGPGKLNINAYQTCNDTKYAGGSTALFLACSANLPSLVKRMLTEYHGIIDVNIQRDLGTTALYIACQYGHYECVSLLVELAADTINVNLSMFDDPTNTPAAICLSPFQYLPTNARGSDENRQMCYDILFEWSSKLGRPSIVTNRVKQLNEIRKKSDVQDMIAGKDKQMNLVLNKLSSGCSKKELDQLMNDPVIGPKLKRLIDCGFLQSAAGK